MESIDRKKAYKAPMTKVVEIKSQRVLCSSPEDERQDWEKGGDI